MGEKITKENIDTFKFHESPVMDKFLRKGMKNLMALDDKELVKEADKHNFDIDGASKAGYTDEQIMAYLKDSKGE